MNYTLNSFVNKNEADALKEMIFRRVRERSEAMSANVQSEVMELAREDFADKNNPFAKIIENAETTPVQSVEAGTDNTTKQDTVGFPQRKLNVHAMEQSKITAETIAASAIQSNFNEARAELSKRKSFIGALDFLNSQAAVSLMRTKTDKFEVVV